MTNELDERLVKKYPKIFVDRYADMKVTCMCWGFPGDGWYEIIDNLCDKIQKHIDNSDGTVSQVVADQVKEKFGGLRFYISGGDETIYKFINEAEDLSYKTCEQCGTIENVGQTQYPSWLFTLCEDCATKRGKIDVWKKNE